MTALLEERPPVTASGPTARSVARQLRLPVALLLALVLLALLVVAATRRGNGALLDPRSYAPGGSHAAAAVLEAQGTPVQVVTSLRDAVTQSSDRTVLVVPFPDELGTASLDQLADVRGNVLLVSPDEALDEVTDDIEVSGDTLDGLQDPRCDLPAAVNAGRARVGAIQYDVRDGTRCYGGGLVVVGRLEALGSGAPLTNVRLGQDGNAALVFGLLGGADRVLWLLPRAGSETGGRRTLVDLLPDPFLAVVAQLGLAVVVLALWRSRRLGRVVVEPLPVVVRAAEAVEGRGRLYRRARAQGRAAALLRAGVLERTAAQLALGRRPEPDALVAAAAERTGRQPSEVIALLYGPDPADDAALVRLAGDLTAFEQLLRRPISEPPRPDQEVAGP